MNQADLDAYVRTMLSLQGYSLDDETVQRVALQFGRIEEMSRVIRDLPLPLHMDPASVFRP